MGLDYSIQSYIKKENLRNAFEWLSEHSTGEISKNIFVGDEFLVEIQTEGLGEESQSLDLNCCNFATSLVFEIDPSVIKVLAFWELEYDMDRIADFQEYFKQNYCNDGTVSIGYFYTSIKNTTNDIFEFQFTAATTDMSVMLTESISVKKWIKEFSEMSDSILTYLDMEDAYKIMYYRGRTLNVQINDSFKRDKQAYIDTCLSDFNAIINL